MTALTYPLDPVDAAVVALLDSPDNLHVHVGAVGDSDDSAKTISAPLPYALYSSALPYQPGPQRLGRGYRPDVSDFTVTATHSSLDGCKAVAAAVRGLLNGHALTVDGKTCRIRLSDPDEPVIVSKDPTWTRPGGLPLFFAVDRYYVL
ncbi:MAG TPA: hypothetical protein VFJ19_07895 [Nocardioidaceae bacterium]|nr:hypothetical protein [Nocardioidaceae bacterium]